jgi:hypothetical protein
MVTGDVGCSPENHIFHIPYRTNPFCDEDNEDYFSTFRGRVDPCYRLEPWEAEY